MLVVCSVNATRVASAFEKSSVIVKTQNSFEEFEHNKDKALPYFWSLTAAVEKDNSSRVNFCLCVEERVFHHGVKETIWHYVSQE